MSKDLLWNQAELEASHLLNSGLVSIVGWSSDRSMKPIGTGFIIACHGDRAIAVTAAHNFTAGLRKVHRKLSSHGSTLSEFLPDHTSLGRKDVRAVYMANRCFQCCILVGAVWDHKTDIAFVELAAQDAFDEPLFQGEFLLDDNMPGEGEEVGVLGYADMGVKNEKRDGNGHEELCFERRLVLRRGCVTRVYPNGYPPLSNFCIETTIPVFGGMSGGAML